MCALALVTTMLALPVAAGPLDGPCHPDDPWAEGWDCRGLGSDGGALAVRNGVFHRVENACQLTNPIEVNGMSAMPCDAQFDGEGESYAKRMMPMRVPEGLAAIEDGFVYLPRPCE